ncbi:murein hydrolase activator EnvC family protein [Phaeovulum sp.]|uniref:murein hydrolase activator EnvC family protein n=1 Tax=Phaeovulum sp. TaxID=2934796 RepID=UPI00272FE3BF|nr:peptidase M23 [Phaeovulum sp.]MDP1668856.1 peptidase M23 [Phaeovulum sp.]MDZ4118193.1 peptidase M23 [Phaeovulum sp.]
MRRALVLALLLAFGAARAELPAAEAARAAAEDLRGTIAALDAARRASDRVAALTATIGAYERGLAALREGLRRVAVREAEIATGFAARQEEIGRLLAVMAVIERTDAPLMLLHPEGALGAARTGMVLSEVTPAVQARADALGAELAELAGLRALQLAAAETLAAGLASAQAARTALSQAVAERTDLPKRYLEEPAELQALLAAAETLDGFALGLADMEQDIGAPMADFAGARGGLPLPVLGTVLRRMNEADAAGIRRPGLILATEPGALVTTPWAATIRYRGPLLDYGNVMIVEPATGYLLVLAGLGTVYGETGEVLAAGAPLGLMGGDLPGAADFGQWAQQGGGARRSETLYMELRQGKVPVDPAVWFTMTRDSQG